MSRPKRPGARPYQRRRDEEDWEGDDNSGFDLLATPRTPHSARSPKTPSTPRNRRQASIYLPSRKQPRKSFSSDSEGEESVVSYSPPRRRPDDSSNRPRGRLERMRRFFAPSHFAPHFGHGPSHWAGGQPQVPGAAYEPKDPVQEQIDQATMRLSLYTSLGVLGSGLAGLFLILAYVLNGLVIAKLPAYTDGAESSPATTLTIRARGDTNAVPGSTLAEMQDGIWGSLLGLSSLVAGIVALHATIFQMFGKKLRKKLFDGLRNSLSGYSDLDDPTPASTHWERYGSWNIKLWYLIPLSLPALAAVIAFLLVFFDQRGTLLDSFDGAGSVGMGQTTVFAIVAAGMLLTSSGLNILKQHLCVWLWEYKQSNGLLPPSGAPYLQETVLQHPGDSPAYQMSPAQPAISPFTGHQRNPSAFSNGSRQQGSAFTLQRNPSTLQRTPPHLQRNPSSFSKASYPAGSAFTVNRSAFTQGSSPYPNGSAFTIQSKRSQRSQRSQQPWGPGQSDDGV